MADCKAVGGVVGRLAGKLGGELVRNGEGMYVLKNVGHDEVVFPNKASALDHMSRTLENLHIANRQWDRLNAAVEKGGKIDIDNAAGILEHTQNMSDAATALGGGEQPPVAMRALMSRGSMAGRFSNFFLRQHAFLMGNGEGGRYLANGAVRADTSYEMFKNQIASKIVPFAKQLDQLTDTAELKTRSAHPDVMAAWDKMGKPLMEGINRIADFLGIGEDLAPRDGSFPTWYGLREQDVDNSFVSAAKRRGVIAPNEGAKELAQRYNEAGFGAKPAGMNYQDWGQRQEWLKKMGAKYAGAANHMRTGEDFMRSAEATMTNWVENISRKLANAAVWGPNEERIHQAKEVIAAEMEQKYGRGTGAFGHHLSMIDKTMQDILGKVHISRTPFEQTLSHLTKGMLSASGPRHLAQFKIAIMQHGWGQAAKMLDFRNWSGSAEEFHNTGAAMRQTQHLMGSNPSDFFEERGPQDVKNLKSWVKSLPGQTPAAVEKLGTTGLHAFLNTGRRLATQMARQSFDKDWNKALSGDHNTLGLMADVYGFGDSTTASGRQGMVERMQQMDKQQARAYYIKRMADLEGTTAHAKDNPGFARSDIGKYLIQFRAFRWNVQHNIWNQMTSPNYSAAHKMKVVARFMSTIPTLSTVDPILRHVKIAGALGVAGGIFGLGRANIDSKMAYDSFQSALKNPKASNELYALYSQAINDGSLGVAADMMQGWNMSNPDISQRSVISGNIPQVAMANNLWIASSLAAGAAIDGDKKARNRALSQALSDIPFGPDIARVMGAKSADPRVPKKQRVKQVLQRGAKAVGLE